MQRRDLTGQKFGRLLAVERKPDPRTTRYSCSCECGAEIIVIGTQLTSGKTKSCGCLKKELLVARNHKHGLVPRGGKTPEYGIWRNMRRRCTDPKDKRFKDYGGRGITVCDRWSSFAKFLEDMGKRPSPELTLDRENNDQGYSLENCRWATQSEQAMNRRSRWRNS
jgi:hypothetical protein